MDTNSNKESRWPAILMIVAIVIGVFFYFLSDVIGYAGYNAVEFGHTSWLEWFTTLFGGLHTYDLTLPFALTVIFLYMHYSKKDELVPFEEQNQEQQEEETDNDGWQVKHLGKKTVLVLGFFLLGMAFLFDPLGRVLLIVLVLFLVVINYAPNINLLIGSSPDDKYKHFYIAFLLMFLSLRVVYFSLFTVNYYTAGEAQPTEKTIIRAESVSDRRSVSYYFYIEVDDGVPCQLEVSETAYEDYMAGKTSKVLAHVRKGCMGFSFVPEFQTQKPNSNVARQEKTENNKAVEKNNDYSETRYIVYGESGNVTRLRMHITNDYKDIPELQRAVSLSLFGEDCTNVFTAYERFVAKHTSTKLTGADDTFVDYPYLEISLVEKKHSDLPRLHAEMTYSEKKGSFDFLCDKDYEVDMLHKKLLTIDNVLASGEAKKIKKKAKGADISLRVMKDHTRMDWSIIFYWNDGDELIEHPVDYDGTSKFTSDFRELITSLDEGKLLENNEILK